MTGAMHMRSCMNHMRIQSVCDIIILVFSKCFRAGYFTFSQLKFKVNKGINLLVFSKCFRAGYYTFSQRKFKVNKRINS